MESTSLITIDRDLLLALVACVLVIAALVILAGKGRLTSRRLLQVLVEVFPWLFFAWFCLGLASCLGAASRIGAGSTDVSMPLVSGIVAGPALFVVSLVARRRVRKYLADMDEDAALDRH